MAIENKTLEETSTVNFWQEKWLKNPQGQPGWDLGGAHPLFDQILNLAIKQGGLKEKAYIFVPGCGRAHNAAKFAGMGFNVTAMDIVPEAISRAKQCYTKVKNLDLVIGDIFTSSSYESEHYDMIFDRAMLCALPRNLRSTYVEMVFKRLRPGGLFASISFAKVGRDVTGPPYAIGIDELQNLFSDKFDLIAAEHHSEGACDEVILKEIINIWRRR
ncbi:MAG: methyltransferase domain-containing protein [Bdellovibrionota bacterium]